MENSNRELLTKYLNNEVNPQEKKEVETWAKQSGKNLEELRNLKQMLDKIDNHLKSKKFNSSAAWENVYSEIKKQQLTVIQQRKTGIEAFKWFYKYAAILVTVILLGVSGFYLVFNNMPVHSEIFTAENEVLNEYLLPDGSLVTLNSNSKLLYPKQFSGRTREVTVIGEAFFDVEPNPEKPFIINAGKAYVKVLGTSFNVCAYPETEIVEVLVISGKVEVTNKIDDNNDNANQIFLLPGEKAMLFNTNNLLTKEINENLNSISWKTRELIFNEMPLNEVIEYIEKVYHINVELSGTGLNNLLLTAHFEQKSVDFILNVIKITFNLELTGSDKQFTFSNRSIEKKNIAKK